MSTRDEASFALPKPIALGDAEVVLSRSDWDRLVEVFNARLDRGNDPDEDAADLAAAAAARADDAGVAARIEKERGSPVEVTIPIEVLEAELEGAHPIKAWREHRKWTQSRLAAESSVARDLIAQIETHRKTGSIQTLNRLARALAVPLEALIEDQAEDTKIGETR
ncbi:MAG TPA: helix-turn-helix transcriptional regulator [Stellaceae bacterium]|jgi:DNA-binding XRE family transcriptional regulator|nr:helix-turn-helix transcriptional regulator [Stellaceae bacterium]